MSEREELGRGTVVSGVIRGIGAQAVRVECAIRPGMGQLVLVGVSEAAALEVRPRVRRAIRGAGFDVPRATATVTVLPLDRDGGPVRITASDRHVELAIAAAVLAASGQVPAEAVDGRLLVGALEPDGEAALDRGAVPYEELARERGLMLLAGSASGAGPLPGPLRCVNGLAALRRGREAGHMLRHDLVATGRDADLADWPGLGRAKIALALSAALGLGVLMLGEDERLMRGLAEGLATILPPPGGEEAAVVRRVASAAMERPAAGCLVPFRAPACATPLAALVGGSRPVRPGEVTLAHGGVLYLERLDLMAPVALGALRRVREQGEVRIERVGGTVRMPAEARLVLSSPSSLPILRGRPAGDADRRRALLGERAASLAELRVDLAGSRRERDPVALRWAALGSEEIAERVLDALGTDGAARPRRPGDGRSRAAIAREAARALAAMDRAACVGPDHVDCAASLLL